MNKKLQRGLALTLACSTLFATSTAAMAADYVVVPGDNLSKIAAQYDTTWQTLAELNKLENPNLIFPQQIIQLPSVAEPVAPVVTPPPTEPVAPPTEGGVGVGDVETPNHYLVADEVGTIDPIAYLALAQGVLNFDGYRAVTDYLNAGYELEAAVNAALADGAIVDGMHGDAKTSAEIAIAMIKRGGEMPSLKTVNDLEAKMIADAGYHAAKDGYYVNGTDVSQFGAADEKTTSVEAEGFGGGAYTQDASDYVEYASGTEIDWTVQGTVGEGQWTLVDNNTGLEWQGDPGAKVTWMEGMEGIDAFNEAGYGGHDDWRIPTIKEVYSLAMLSGYMGKSLEETTWFVPYDLEIGLDENQTVGDRWMDRQIMTSTVYDDYTVGSVTTVFGWNGVDGRIKGYPTNKTFYSYRVRNTDGSAPTYGMNMFESASVTTGSTVANKESNATVNDLATNLEWTKYDSIWFYENDASAKAWVDANTDKKDGSMDWEEGLAFSKWANDNKLGGHDDWRLPASKELHSILDYSSAPGTTGYAAINKDFFQASPIVTFGVDNFGYYVSATLFNEGDRGYDAVYVGFGRTLGTFDNLVLDVHGAGAQRDDAQALSENESPDQYPKIGFGPQGDDVRVYNLVRLARDSK